MTDPRLVAALGAALHHYRGTCELWTISEAACPIDHRVDAAAILPAFLAGPRVAEVFAERLHSEVYGEDLPMPDDDVRCRNAVASILGREP